MCVCVQILKGLRETLEEASAAPLPAGASSSTAESIKEGLVQVGVRLMPPPPLLLLLRRRLPSPAGMATTRREMQPSWLLPRRRGRRRPRGACSWSGIG